MIAYLTGIVAFHIGGATFSSYVIHGMLFLSILIFFGLKTYRWLCFFLIAVSWASVYSAHITSKIIDSSFEGVDLIASGYVCSLPNKKEQFVTFELCGSSLSILGQADKTLKRLRLKLSWYTKDSVDPVGLNTFVVRIKKPHGLENPYGFSYEKWLFRKAISGVGYIKKRVEPSAIESEVWFSEGRAGIFYQCPLLSFSCYITFARTAVSRFLDTKSDQLNNRALIKALTLGYRGEIDGQVWEVLKNTGTQHLIAISGLHIGLVFASTYFLVFTLLRIIGVALPLKAHEVALRRRVPISLLSSLILSFSYSAIAGFAISTQRALIMVAVFTLCSLFRVGGSAYNRLLLAAVVVLIVDPNSVLDNGFWLSFLAVAVLFLSSMKNVKAQALPRYARLGGAVKLQWAISVGLFPVLLAGGMGVSYTSLVANLVVIPFIGCITVPLLLLSFLVVPFSNSLSELLLVAVDGSLSLFLWFIELLSGFEAVSISLESAIFGLSLCLLALFAIVYPLFKAVNIWALSVVLLLIVFKEQPPENKKIEVVVFDVGQGLAVTALHQRHAVIYDTGPSYREGSAAERSILPYLKAKGVKEVDWLLLSHGDDDHAGGAHILENELNIAELISGEPSRISSKSVVKKCRDGDKRQTDWYRATFYAATLPVRLSSNERSCVVRLVFDDISILLMGDLEKRSEMSMVKRLGGRLESDILIAGHHGSKNATSNALLGNVKPKVVIFSTGYKNRFNHPHPDVLSRVTDFGSKIYNTADDGAIVIRQTSSAEWAINGQRALQSRIWHVH